MTIALSPTTAVPPAKLRSITTKAPIRQWQDELEHLGKEVVFYQKLLKMGIKNCPENKKPCFYELLDGFSDFADTVVPNLKSDLAHFGTGDTEPALVFAFQKRMEGHRTKFVEMKESVFPLIQYLQKFTIW